MMCNGGSPWDQSPAGLDRWRAGLEALAQLPNVVCKVSGLGMFNPDWTVDSLRPVVLTLIEVFGPQRIMFGSNFPVDKLYNSYDALWDAYYAITTGFSAEEKRCMFYGTAAKFYRI